MTLWTRTDSRVPADWDLVVAVDADHNCYLVEWDEEKGCFWDQGTRYLKTELIHWMPVAEPPAELSESETHPLPLAS